MVIKFNKNFSISKIYLVKAKIYYKILQLKNLKFYLDTKKFIFKIYSNTSNLLLTIYKSYCFRTTETV
jgi:hypothetical protein